MLYIIKISPFKKKKRFVSIFPYKFSMAGYKSEVENTADSMVENHKNKVENPDDGETENQTNDPRNDFALRKTRNESAYPRGKRNDSQNKADYPTKTKVIFLCHNSTSHRIFYYERV